jgi:hypothetical protein
MPGTKLSMCTVLATGFALAGAATAAAQQDELPPCPGTDELITTYAPDYLRIGAALAFTIERRAPRVCSK